MIFGPKRLPQVGHTLGKALKNFKDGLAGVREADFRKLEDPDLKKQKEGDPPVV